MKVKGKVSVHWIEDSISDNIRLKVKFKLPNQIFYRTRKSTIVTTWSCNTLDEFWSRCYDRLNREYLENEAKEMIIGYIKEKYNKTDKDINIEKVDRLIKELNQNFEVEVEYDISKQV